ncbi:LPS-assembly protein LptD, partial [bacterium]
MRRVLALVAFLAPVFAAAQFGVPVEAVVRAIQDSPARIPLSTPKPATAASGFPVPVEPRELPPPQGGLPNQLQVISAGGFRRTGETQSYGKINPDDAPAELIYRGYRIFADRIDLNPRTNVVQAKGNVRLIGENASVTGEEVDFDFRTQTYTARRSRSRIGQELSGGNVRGDLFVRGDSNGTRQRFVVENGGITTCLYDDPHYTLDARSGVVRPGREARLKDVRLKILGKTVARFGSLWIPLADREYEYT